MTTNITDYPLISAIMLAGKSPIEDVKLAIECFKTQTYPYKELIIINNAKSHFEATSLNIKAERNIFLLDTPTTYHAGTCRNFGISSANGQILAQFDPDYWYDKSYLETQAANLAECGANVIFLQSTLAYSFASGLAAYNQNDSKSILNTMVYIRPNGIDYPHTNHKEEEGLLQRLISNNYQVISVDAPHLACKLYTTSYGKVFKPKNYELSKEHFSIVKKIVKIAENLIDK